MKGIIEWLSLSTKKGGKEPSYHWLREDFNSKTWSHKDGHGPVRNLDYKGNLITNPLNAKLGEYNVRRFFYVPRGGVKPICLDAGL